MSDRRVSMPVPPEVAFDYLVDPRRRPEWQSSLARVEGVSGEPRVGQTWVDVTRPGLRAAMETTELDRPTRWTERGTWRGVGATLTLSFAPAPGGCTVAVDFAITGPGPLGPLMRLVTIASRPAVRADLRRAARALGS